MAQATLAERLGYGPEDRLLIVNCDDLGSSHSANVATFRSMIYGVATSATLMVPCPWAREAVRMFQGLSVGLHLTLTCEYRGYRWRGLTDCKSFRDKDGFLPLTARSALQSADVDEVRAECRAQMETALAWGVDLTHIDAHMGVAHARADLFDICLELAAEFGLPIRLDALSARREGFNPRERAEARGVLFNEHLLVPWPRRTQDVFNAEIPRLQPGVTEIFAHPVLDGEELRAYDLENADIRVHDFACLTDPATAALLDEHNVKRISFRQLRDLQRAGA